VIVETGWMLKPDIGKPFEAHGNRAKHGKTPCFPTQNVGTPTNRGKARRYVV
jgi:hypothetical protein